MTDKQKKTIMMRTQGKTCCKGCGKVIHPETDDLSRVEYVKTKRGNHWFFHTACAGNVWGRKDQLGKVKENSHEEINTSPQ